MKTNLKMILDPDIHGSTAFLINGKLHVSSLLHADILYGKRSSHLQIIDTDEINYRNHISEIKVFAGQQVQVFDNGLYIGDGTITDYPYQLDFGLAEVCLHYPVKGETSVYPVNHMIPLCC